MSPENPPTPEADRDVLARAIGRVAVEDLVDVILLDDTETRS